MLDCSCGRVRVSSLITHGHGHAPLINLCCTTALLSGAVAVATAADVHTSPWVARSVEYNTLLHTNQNYGCQHPSSAAICIHFWMAIVPFRPAWRRAQPPASATFQATCSQQMLRQRAARGDNKLSVVQPQHGAPWLKPRNSGCSSLQRSKASHTRRPALAVHSKINGEPLLLQPIFIRTLYATLKSHHRDQPRDPLRDHLLLAPSVRSGLVLLLWCCWIAGEGR